MEQKKLALVYFKLVLVAFFWAGTFIATRMAAQVFGPFTGASLRYVVALSLMIPLCLAQDKNFFLISRKQFFQVFLLGLTGIFGYSFFFFNGMKLVPASHGALLVALNPAFVMILTSFQTKQKIGKWKWVGLFFSLIGVVVVISRGNYSNILSGFQWGDAFMLGCPATWALYTFFAGTALKTIKPLQAATWATLTGWAMILLFVPFEPFPMVVAPEIWMAVTYLGIFGTVLGFVWYYEGIQKIGPLKTSIFNNLIPVFALVLSVVVLGEQVEASTLLGAFFVITGVVIINRK